MKQKFSASLMGMDWMNAQRQILSLNNHTDRYHVDIIDWHYAKNMCLSPEFISQMRPIAKKPIEVHLMVEGTELEIAMASIKAGADIISFQAENIRQNVFKYIDAVKSSGKKFGVVVNPATPLEEIQYYIDQIDLLTFMAVTPGFAGQKLVVPVLDKIRKAHRLREKHHFLFETQIDGGCHPERLREVYETGVDYIILGNTCLYSQSKDPDVAWQKMEEMFAGAIADGN